MIEPYVTTREQGHRPRPRDRQEDRRGACRRDRLRRPAPAAEPASACVFDARPRSAELRRRARPPNDATQTYDEWRPIDGARHPRGRRRSRISASWSRACSRTRAMPCRTAGDSSERAAGDRRAAAEPGPARRLAAGLEARRARRCSTRSSGATRPCRCSSSPATATSTPRSRRSAQGAVDFIEKPFEAERLLHLVARATETERLRRENARAARSRSATTTSSPATRCAINQVRATLKRVATDRQPGADHRPGRRRQGSRRAAAPRLEPARRQRLRRRHRRAMTPERVEEELFGEEAEGKLVRAGPARAGRWRHAVPRRDRRHAAHHPGARSCAC